MTMQLGLFMHAAFQDGTFAVLRSPEELLDVLNEHEKRVEGAHAFLVTSCDELNELAPAEVLTGRYFQARGEAPGRSAMTPDGMATVPYTETDLAAQRRILERSSEERAALVIAAAKHWGIHD